MLKTNENQKIQMLSKAIKIALFSTSLMTTFSLLASSETIQINDIDGSFIEAIEPDKRDSVEQLTVGEFDLKEDESSSIVSATTEPVEGHSPGIRTVALVNNTNGQLSMCSTVTVNYQILDMDGDWDPVQGYEINNEREVYFHKKTSDTIVWKLVDEKGDVMVLDDSFFKADGSGLIRNDRLSFKIPNTINFNGEGVRTTQGLKLQYEITPWTMYGSFPRTLGESFDTPVTQKFLDSIDRSINVIEVADLTKGMRLDPEKAENGAIEATAIDANSFKDNDVFSLPNLSYEGIPQNIFTKNAFIVANEIVEGECLPVDMEKIEIDILEIDAKDPNQQTIVTNNVFYVDRAYKARIRVFNPVSELYEDKTEQLKDFVTWSIYETQGTEIIDKVKFMTAKGMMNVPSDEAELKEFDPRNANYVEDKSLSTHFVSSDNLIFKTQTTNKESIEQLKNQRPNFSEQSLKLRVDLVLPSLDVDLLF